jgi:hypothetical protein
MNHFMRLSVACSLLLLASLALVSPARSGAVEMRISRDALERTLKDQLFGGPDGRYYLKGSLQTPCFTYVEDPKLSFVQDRIVVRVKVRARLGRAVAGACIGLPIALPAEVSLAPDAQGDIIGFRDARLDRVSDQKELNFLLNPFLSRQIPSSMKVNASDLLRKALEGSTATSGYKVTLDRLKIHSIQITADTLVVDVDGDISVK